LPRIRLLKSLEESLSQLMLRMRSLKTLQSLSAQSVKLRGTKMFKKFNDWLDSLSDNVWMALMMGMSLIVSYAILGGLQ